MGLLPGRREALVRADTLDEGIGRPVLVVGSQANQRGHHGPDVGPPAQRPAGECAGPLAPSEQLDLPARGGVQEADGVHHVFGRHLNVPVRVVRDRHLAVGPAQGGEGRQVVPSVRLTRVEERWGQDDDDVPRRPHGRRRAGHRRVEHAGRHVERWPGRIGRCVGDRRCRRVRTLNRWPHLEGAHQRKHGSHQQRHGFPHAAATASASPSARTIHLCSLLPPSSRDLIRARRPGSRAGAQHEVVAPFRSLRAATELHPASGQPKDNFAQHTAEPKVENVTLPELI